MLKRLLIKFALNILKVEVLDKIQYAPVAGLTTAGFTVLQHAAEIVTDNEADNKTQFAAYFKAEKKNLLLLGINTTEAVLQAETSSTATAYIVAFLDEVRQEITDGNLLKAA